MILEFRILLMRVGLWIAALGGWSPTECSRPHVDLDPALRARIEALTALQEIPGLSGEAKRHQVYARLIKDFPRMTRREISLAIEVALSESP